MLSPLTCWYMLSQLICWHINCKVHLSCQSWVIYKILLSVTQCLPFYTPNACHSKCCSSNHDHHCYLRVSATCWDWSSSSSRSDCSLLSSNSFVRRISWTIAGRRTAINKSTLVDANLKRKIFDWVAHWPLLNILMAALRAELLDFEIKSFCEIRGANKSYIDYKLWKEAS